MRRGRESPEDARPSQLPEQPETPAWLVAVRAAESKKALRPLVLDLRDVSSFTDYFLICSGNNSRQIQAIADAIDLDLDRCGQHALGLEGYEHAEWILADYGDLIVHVFSEPARTFYDLERLWRHAKAVEPGPSDP